MSDFDIKDIFKTVWGIVPGVKVPGQPSWRDVEGWAGVSDFNISARSEGSAGIYGRQDVEVSWMGTDVMFPFYIGGENLKVFDDLTGVLKREYVSEFQVPVATLVDFSREKDIVKTSMSSGYGTVKELFSFGDWRLSIRGLLFDENKDERTMIQMRRELLKFEKYADSIPVRGWLFNEMKIDRVVINSINLKQIQGKPWVMPFEMSCDSDSSPNLLIN